MVVNQLYRRSMRTIALAASYFNVVRKNTLTILLSIYLLGNVLCCTRFIL